MKKGLLMGFAVVASVATLTGCNTTGTKTLKCTRESSTDGFSNKVVETYTFKKNKIIKAENKTVVKLSGDSTQYYNDYKASADKAVEQYKEKKGATAKIATNNTDEITITATLDVSKMSDSDIKSYRLDESIESMNDKLTKEGYTCK